MNTSQKQAFFFPDMEILLCCPDWPGTSGFGELHPPKNWDYRPPCWTLDIFNKYSIRVYKWSTPPLVTLLWMTFFVHTGFRIDRIFKVTDYIATLKYSMIMSDTVFFLCLDQAIQKIRSTKARHGCTCCNPSYSGGRRITNLKLAQAKIGRPYLKNKNTK
jgi:hypothetical protein